MPNSKRILLCVLCLISTEAPMATENQDLVLFNRSYLKKANEDADVYKFEDLPAYPSGRRKPLEYEYNIRDCNNFYQLENEVFPGLGRMSFVSISESVVSKPLYISGWVPGDTKYENFNVVNYEKYSFEKFIDCPIKTYFSRKVSVNDQANYSITTEQSYKESRSNTSVKGSETFMSFLGQHTNNTGFTIPLKGITLSGGQENSAQIQVSNKSYEEVRNTISSETYYSTIESQTFSFINKESFPVTYEVNYRQKFIIYIVQALENIYSTTVTSSGLFGRDKTYKYSVSSHNGKGTYYYLLPVENPYIDVNRYYDDNKGIKTLMDRTNPGIFFI